MRRKAKNDANQAQVVEGLRKLGYSVLILSRVGEGCPDLLVGNMGRNWLIELKDGSKYPSERKLTPDQETFFSSWRGQVNKAESLEEILDIIYQKKTVVEKTHPDVVKKVEEIVAGYYGLSLSQIASKTRKRPVVTCRQTCCAMLRRFTNLTLREIGERFGRDHTTAVHAIKTINDLIEVHPDLKFHFDRIDENIRQGIS